MEVVAYYVAKARSGAVEDAFHGLQELGDDALPAMQSAYHVEDDPNIRALIVEAIWQHRQPSRCDFLADALRDSAAPVWKQALDGLVTLASPASMRVLRSAGDRETDPERRAWIEEAIDQTAESLARQATR